MRRSAAALALLLLSAAAVGAATACGDLKPAGPAGPAGADAAADAPGPNLGPDAGGAPPRDGATPPDAPAEASARTGPGPHGSLPSGYCCSADPECRYRHCVDPTGSSGPKMCVDECYDPLFCARPGLTFTCEPPGSGSGAGLCKPPAGFACLDPSTFTRGPKEIGACCNAGVGGTNDGTAGSICEGYTCMSSGNNPLICTHRCAFQADCPGGYVCDKFGTSKACLLLASPYTCTP